MLGLIFISYHTLNLNVITFKKTIATATMATTATSTTTTIVTIIAEIHEMS